MQKKEVLLQVAVTNFACFMDRLFTIVLPFHWSLFHESVLRLLNRHAVKLALLLMVSGCGNRLPQELTDQEKESAQEESSGESVTPPFKIRGDLNGLLLVWFDKQGLHTATTLAEIPKAHRQYVRVDSLQVPPDKRLDPEYVYIADLRKNPGDKSDYPVKKYPRVWFEQLVEKEVGALEEEQPVAAPANESVSPSSATSENVIIYGASWCGACRAAAAYFRQKKIAFVEKDIEKDKQAYSDMQKKARTAGVQPGALPLIDFRGQIISGFSPDALNRLIK